MKQSITICAALLLTTSLAHAAPVSLTWNPNTEPDLAGYKIYHGNVSRAYSAHVEVPAAANEQKQATIDIQPEDGRTVYFAATAYDSAGNESDYSAEVTWVVPDHTPPGVVQGFRLTVEMSLNESGELAMKLVRIERSE